MQVLWLDVDPTKTQEVYHAGDRTILGHGRVMIGFAFGRLFFSI